MQIHIFTLFPSMFQAALGSSIIGRAVTEGLLDIRYYNFREYAHDRHRTVDDYSYGGGPGMVLKPEPLFEAVESALGAPPSCPVILLTPQGRPFRHAEAQRLARMPAFALLCGHYGGVDERVRQHLATEELSIGDYVLTGGELAAMVVVDAVARLLPGVLGSEGAAAADSHAAGFLQHPQYTRPAEFRGWRVPDVLLLGNHQAIARWRRRQALLRTWQRRPDLLESASLTPEERSFLKAVEQSEREKRA
ncbi:MAG: tRNA (guanosine(37)-N1)-methyltransferase TrmD [Chloroflexi bacterium]|nr:tRNA (guanosine(37)-N1)-methyltransferase TrmD [Chloroflexota bacterium]